MCGKRCKRYQNIFYWVKKMNLFVGVLDIEEIREQRQMKQVLKEGRNE